MTTLRTLQNLLNKNFGLDPNRLDAQARLEDLDIDSLAIVEVLFDIENQFQVTVPSESAGQHASLKTIGDLVHYIDRLIAEQHPVSGEMKASN
ncbi:MAG: acyl carrier protein [Burkholderiales bacterium]|jgi:acyl carrier protein